MRRLRRLRSLRVRYWKPIAVAALLVVALLCALLVFAAIPSSRRPASPLWVVPAALTSWVVLVVAWRRGWTKIVKHEVLDRIGGDVDDATPWLLATLSAAAFLVAVGLVGADG